MTNKEFGDNLEKRSRLMAVNIIKLSATLPNTEESKVIRYQLSKSASSIGANYHEANRSRSRRDFVNKLKISQSEANETIFWLTVLNDLDWLEDNRELNLMIKEVKEFIAIFTSIINKLKESN